MDFVQAQDKNCIYTKYENLLLRGRLRKCTNIYDVRATYYNLNRKP